MAKMKQKIMSLAMALVMAFSLLPTAALAEGEMSGTVTFDIFQGSVTANADGVTGWPKDAEEAVTLTWDEVANCDIVVTGKSDNGENVITVAEECEHDLELTLENVEIVSSSADKKWSAISIQTPSGSPVTLTVNLKGNNVLSATAGRLLWAQNGSTMKFVGQDTDGKKATLNLSDDESGISLLYSGGNGLFDFENCDVTMAGREMENGTQVFSDGTKVALSRGASITDSTGKVFSNDTELVVNHDISTGNLTINKEYTVKCGRNGTLIYRDPNVTYVVIGTSTSNRVTVTYPEAKVVLQDLSITMENKSAFLVKYEDPDDYEKTLTVQVSGNVKLTTSSASAFNTNESESKGYSANVKLVGIADETDDVVTIARSQDNALSMSSNAAVGVDLTVENATVIINKNCKFDVTAGAGSLVGVAGIIGGTGVEVADGKLIRGTFDYRFTEGGREFKAVADKSNDGMLTLLLPSSADLSAVTMEVTDDWTVTVGEEELTGDTVLNFANAENNTLSLTIEPPAYVKDLFEVTGQTVQVKAMQGSEDIPAVYLHLTKGSMAEVNGDKDHETKAKGDATILGANDLNEAAVEIKGRGNASWGRAKKSYQIKLDSKANVLGMGKSKKWILLPSAADLSMVRSAIGFDLAQKLDMEHASNWKYVDFYVDGEYYGLYILCEKAEIGENRIDIDNIDDALEDAIGKDKYLSNVTDVDYSDDHGVATLADGTKIDLTGGYHLEFDNYSDPLQFAAGGIQKITVKEPEYLGEAPNTDDSFTYIRDFMGAAGAAVNGTDEAELRKYIDLESFAQMWLLKQYMNDFDATNNMHIWKKSDSTGAGLLHAGLAWDFDNSMCRDVYDLTKVIDTATASTTFKNSGSAKWLKLLEKHPAFQEELVRQYELHKDLFTCCEGCACVSDPAACDPAACDTCDTCYVHRIAAEQAKLIADSAAMDTIR